MIDVSNEPDQIDKNGLEKSPETGKNEPDVSQTDKESI